MKYLFALSIALNHLFCFGQTHSLDFFIQQAKQNSPLLKDLQNQIFINQLDSQILRASRRNQVNFINSNSYAPLINGWGYDNAITNIANISAVVQANRNFLSRNNLSAQFQTLALQSRALLDTIKLSEKDLVRTITEQYIMAYGNLLMVDFNKDVYDLLKKEEETLKKLTEASVYKQTDYLSFYVTLQQQELTYLQSQFLYNTDYLMLNWLAGIVDTTIQRIEVPVITDTLQYDFYQSVFYQRFITDSLRLANEKRLIYFEYKPRIGAYADAGFVSSLQILPYKNFGFSAGLSLNIPIYDGHQRRLKYAKVDIRERTRLTNRSFFVNQYRQQIAQLKQQLYGTDLLVDKINQQITNTHTLITANGKLLETGDIPIKDYILSINNYLNARNLLTQNNISRLRIVNQINYWNR